MKIVVIGAGSAAFGRGILVDVIGSREINKIDCTLSLVDIDKSALKRMFTFGEKLKKHFRSSVKIEATTDRAEALQGANYVIISVAIRRALLWEQDFRIPLAYGFKHVLGENGGPGALFHTLRNFELVIPICRDIVDICPDALIINFTNPVTRIVMAINYLTKAHAIGLCHGILDARDKISEILGRPLNQLDIIAGGLNHFFWVLKISDAKTGEDLYPEFRQRVLIGKANLPPLVRKMVEIFGYFTYPSDRHIGEYLSFASEFTGLLWEDGVESIPVPRFDGTSEPPDSLEPYITGEKEIDRTVTQPSGELAVPIICDIEFDKGKWEPAVNVINRDFYVENLPKDSVVEVPAVIDAKGIHPQHIGSLPEPLAAFSRTQISIQKLIIEAYKQRSRRLLLQALLLDPLVDSYERAEKLLDKMLEIQSEYLPKFDQ